MNSLLNPGKSRLWADVRAHDAGRWLYVSKSAAEYSSRTLRRLSVVVDLSTKSLGLYER